MAESTSDFMRNQDKKIKEQNPSIPEFTYDEKAPYKAVSALTAKVQQNRIQATIATIKSTLKLNKEEKSGPITQHTTVSPAIEEAGEQVPNKLEITDITVATESSIDSKNKDDKDDGER